MTKPFPKSEMRHWKNRIVSSSPYHTEYAIIDDRNWEKVGGWVEYKDMGWIHWTKGWIDDYEGQHWCMLSYEGFMKMKDIHQAMYDYILKEDKLLRTFERPKSPFIGDYKFNVA